MPFIDCTILTIDLEPSLDNIKNLYIVCVARIFELQQISFSDCIRKIVLKTSSKFLVVLQFNRKPEQHFRRLGDWLYNV